MLQNTAQLKKSNCHLLKQVIKVLGVATKSDMMRLSGLSLATCSNLVNEMVKSGELLVCKEIRAGETGRPSSAYLLNAEFASILCIFPEVQGEGSILHYTVTNLEGKILSETRENCENMDYTAIHMVVQRAIEDYPNIAVIGISIQGIVGQGGVISKCDAPLLCGLRLSEKLTASFDLPVICENDMNVLANGMIQDGDLVESDSVAVLAQYQAVLSGAGLIVDGHILRGSTNFAGEVSFLPMQGLSESERVAQQIISIAAVANPAVVAVVGDVVTERMLEVIKREVLNNLPKAHCPELILLQNPFVFSQKGMASLCLKKFNGEEL